MAARALLRALRQTRTTPAALVAGAAAAGGGTGAGEGRRRAWRADHVLWACAAAGGLGAVATTFTVATAHAEPRPAVRPDASFSFCVQQ
jgi:hypothetical protein